MGPVQGGPPVGEFVIQAVHHGFHPEVLEGADLLGAGRTDLAVLDRGSGMGGISSSVMGCAPEAMAPPGRRECDT